MGFHIINKDGLIIGFVETEAEALALLANVPEDVYRFFVGGLPRDVDKFMLDINGGLGVSPTFFEMLENKYGRVPETIVPFEEIKEAYFKHTGFFLKIRMDILDSRLAAQLLSVLRRTVPAGASFFVLIERREIAEEFSMDRSGEEVAVFYAPDVPDEGHDNVSETVLAAQVV
jgi:hypothetical protein